jgi:hypothetical protein
MRILFLRLIYPFLKLAGKLHLPFTHKQVTGHHYFDAQQVVQPGDVLLSHAHGEFTNLLIPGFWKHAAIYCGQGEVIEAVAEGVIKTHLVQFMLSKDFVTILRPAFLTPIQNEIAAIAARGQVGKPYDYELRSGIEAFYCAELPWFSIMTACLPEKCPFEMRLMFGEFTVAPQDYAEATDKFSCVWSSRNLVTRRPI